MFDYKKVFLSLVVLATLITSIAMIVGNVGREAAVHAQQASRKSVTSTDFYAPAQGDAWGTAFDSQGHVWLALPGCDFTPYCQSGTPGKITEFDPSTNSWITTYSLPSSYAQPLFLAFDKNGMLWFTMPSSNSIAMLNPTNNTFQSWSVPTAASGPWGITIDLQGTIWFTEHYANKIGSFNPTNHTFHEVATSVANSVPYGITVDGSDNVWFTENDSANPMIAEYTQSGNLKEFPVPTNGATQLTPHLITVDTNGNIWWSEGWVGKIAKLNVALAQPGTGKGITQYSYNLSGTHTSGIGVDSTGKIWFDDSLQSIYGSFPESGSGTFSIYNTPTQNAHPHDGLNVDKKDRIWFDEQFINKLAVAVQAVGGTPTPTSTTPTSTPTPGQKLGKDTFQRANQTHWGNASDGQTWGGDANNVSAFSIAGNAGLVSNGGGNSYSAVLGPSTTNAEVVVSGSLSSFSNANFGAVLRWTDGNNWYKAYVDGNSFYIQKKVAGATTFVATAAFSAKAGTAYTIRFQVTGSTLNAKVWVKGTTEPSNWTITASDTSLASGYCGIRVLTQSGTATFTSFKATSL
ncbi:MAG: hypothetical protein NVS4B7_11470 [Ktedonobacteraceae bacterium]